MSEWRSPPEIWQQVADAAREHHKNPTPAEARLWQALRGRKLDGWRIRRQHAIAQFIADFYCAEAKLVIEIDGAIHQQTKSRDEERTVVLEAMGFRVVRFHNAEVMGELGGGASDDLAGASSVGSTRRCFCGRREYLTPDWLTTSRF